jgi:hypothetical protein
MVESEHAIAGAPPQDLIYPVNLALRFTPWQDIGASRGVTAAGKLGRDVTYHLRRLGCSNPNTRSAPGGTDRLRRSAGRGRHPHRHDGASGAKGADDYGRGMP